MISIVILTFNNKEFISSCLDSVFMQDYKDFEVIIVDNGSNDGTDYLIKNNYPQVNLIRNKENLGTCKARNQGIEVAIGEWILILDVDVILEKDFLKSLMEFTEEIEECVGSFQPKILNMDKKIVFSCGIYLTRLKRFYDIGKGEFDNGQFNAPRYIFGACCAAALYKRQMLEEIKEPTGYFDNRFFFLVEDVDLALRAQRKGWKALYYPKAACYHFGDSSKISKDKKQYLCWRNRKLLLQKCELSIFKLFIISLFYDLPRLFFLLLTNSYVWNSVGNKEPKLNENKAVLNRNFTHV